MKKNIALLAFLFVFTFGFSQKKTTEKIDSTLLKSNKIDFFDYSIFKSEEKAEIIDNNSKTIKKVKSKMPVFVPKGNYKSRVVKVDIHNNYSLRIHKVE